MKLATFYVDKMLDHHIIMGCKFFVLLGCNARIYIQVCYVYWLNLPIPIIEKKTIEERNFFVNKEKLL